MVFYYYSKSQRIWDIDFVSNISENTVSLHHEYAWGCVAVLSSELSRLSHSFTLPSDWLKFWETGSLWQRLPLCVSERKGKRRETQLWKACSHPGTELWRSNSPFHSHSAPSFALHFISLPCCCSYWGFTAVDTLFQLDKQRPRETPQRWNFPQVLWGWGGAWAWVICKAEQVCSHLNSLASPPPLTLSPSFSRL